MVHEIHPTYKLTHAEKLFCKLLYNKNFAEGTKIISEVVRIKKNFLMQNSMKIAKMIRQYEKKHTGVAIKRPKKKSSNQDANCSHDDIAQQDVQHNKNLKINENGDLMEGETYRYYNMFEDLNPGDFAFKFVNPYFKYMLNERELVETRKARRAHELKYGKSQSGYKQKEQELRERQIIDNTIAGIKLKYVKMANNGLDNDTGDYISLSYAMDLYLKKVNRKAKVGFLNSYPFFFNS